jgi:glutamyl-tRNA reductase
VIVVVGLSHRSAPVEVRERLAVAPSDLALRLDELKRRTGAGEMVLLCTCNRVEVMAAAQTTGDDSLGTLASRIVDELEAGVLQPEVVTAGVASIRPHLYVRESREAIEHLFRVAGSLDSLVVGEPQILGQLKDAFASARAGKAVGPWLNRAFEHAFRVAKRVRTETSLGTGQVSIPTVAVDLAREIFSTLAEHKVVLVGTGEMATLVATLLGRAGAKVLVVGRTAEKARELAQRLGAEPRKWEDLASLMVEADIVVSSTSARDHVITLDHITQAKRQRHGRNLFLVDLAVPRDVDPRVGKLDGVFLYNVDDLAHVADAALADRQKEAEKAAHIVDEETESYLRRAHAERITPTLVALRERFHSVLEAELERSLRGERLTLDETQKEALRRAVGSAVDKMLHAPTERLRAWAKDENFGDWHTDLLVSAIEGLFQLGDEATPAPHIESERAKR